MTLSKFLDASPEKSRVSNTTKHLADVWNVEDVVVDFSVQMRHLLLVQYCLESVASLEIQDFHLS